MIRKILSNGRVGVARGALDAALVLDIPHGGWMLSDDPVADERLPDKYHLQEMKTRSVAKCVERNVKEAEGTLILTFTDNLPDDARCARKSADKYHVPWLHINLARTQKFEAVQSIHEWLKERNIQVVHVVGATNGNDGEKVNNVTSGLLEAVYFLGLIDSNTTATYNPASAHQEKPPQSIDEIASRIYDGMTLKDRVIVANFQESQLELLQSTLGRFILIQIERWQKSFPSVFSIDKMEEGISTAEDVYPLVISRLWERLRDTHRLRIVK